MLRYYDFDMVSDPAFKCEAQLAVEKPADKGEVVSEKKLVETVEAESSMVSSADGLKEQLIASQADEPN